jgi:adenine/guanine phosphoribosyltransferase-like PRPP-binding protein
VERLGGTVAGVAVLAELADLEGRKHLADYPVTSLLVY